MSALRRLVARVFALVTHRAADREVREEIASHLALAAAEYERQGLPPDEARRRAALALGGVDAARGAHRDARGLPTLDSVTQDLTYALRGFRREPGFTVVAVLMLAIGIGANTAVFSVVNPLLLRPLPFREASQLVWIADTREGLSGVTYPVAVFEEIQRNARSFDEMAPYFAFFGYLSYVLTGSGPPERLSAVMVGPRFFEVLGVHPAAGRLFTKEELTPNGPQAVVLSHGLWQRRFAGDPAIVGRTLVINDQPHTVAGVLPASFDFASVFAPGQRTEMFVPARLDDMRQWGNTLSVVGRLKPGVSVDAARAELAQLMPRLRDAHPDWGRRDARLTPLKDQVSGPVSQSLVVLWGAVGLVILIVCTNLSNLLLARTTGRSREIALRMALGASRARVMRQLLTEGVVLSLTGAAFGVGLAWLLTTWLRSSETLSLPLLSRMTIDGDALLFTAGLGCLTGLAFAALPALRISSRNPQHALREQSRGSTDGRRQAWVRGVLVAAEIALACVLLVGAALLLRSFYELQQVDLGFRPSQASAIRVDPSTPTPIDNTRGDAARQRHALFDELVRQVASLPGVDAVGLTDALPLDRNRTWNLRAIGRDEQPGESVGPFVYVVGPGYFAAMGIPLRDGRDFSSDDTADRPGVVVVNESAARLLWPGESPIGRAAQSGSRPLQVVGVVADVRQTTVEEGGQPQMYVSFRQFGGAGTELIVRSTLPASALGPAVRERIAAVDPTLVVSPVKPIGNLVERAISPRKFLLRLLGGFAGIALLLACLGIYGLVSYTVSQRVQEIGVRMALGATAGDVRRLVMGGTLRLAAVGLGLGLVAALLLARLITALLYSTSPTDAGAFAVAALVLLLVALIASAVPAFRAARTNPLTALRGD